MVIDIQTAYFDGFIIRVNDTKARSEILTSVCTKLQKCEKVTCSDYINSRCLKHRIGINDRSPFCLYDDHIKFMKKFWVTSHSSINKVTEIA